MQTLKLIKNQPKSLPEPHETGRKVVNKNSLNRSKKRSEGEVEESKAREENGAGTKSRTRDLLITSQLLYQLSYTGTNLRRE